MYDNIDLVLAIVMTCAVMSAIHWLRARRMEALQIEQREYYQARLDESFKARGQAFLERGRRGVLLHEAYALLDHDQCPALHASIERELGLHSTCTHQFRRKAKLGPGFVTCGVCEWCGLKVTEQEMNDHASQ